MSSRAKLKKRSLKTLWPCIDALLDAFICPFAFDLITFPSHFRPFNFPAPPSSHVPRYDVPELTRLLDWIDLMAYDLHGSWEPQTGIHVALYARPEEQDDDEQKTLNVVGRDNNDNFQRERLTHF